MNSHTANQTWVVERGGDVVEKKAQAAASLTDWEQLVYCLWVTDYMMRNAGDFANAEMMYPDFQTDAARFAKSLGLATTYQTFSLSRRKLQRKYFDHFEAICEEIKRAEGGTTPNTTLEPPPVTRVSPLSRLARWFRRGSAPGKKII